VDLHITGGEPTDAERGAVDGLLGPPVSGWYGGTRDVERDGHAAHGGRRAWGDRDQLLPALHAVQDHIGWVSRGALNYICRRLSVPPAEAWGVVTFYHLLATEPRAPVVAHVCDDIACRLKGAEQICRDLEAEHVRRGEASAFAPSASADGSASPNPAALPAAAWQRSPCLGQCDRAPAALVIAAGPHAVRREHTNLTGADDVRRAIETTAIASSGEAKASPVRTRREGSSKRTEGRGFSLAQDSFSLAQNSLAQSLLRRVGRVDPTSLDDYRASGGYHALARAIELGRDEVIAEITASGLLGRGGAAFPTGRKWAAVAQERATPHYVVCNADESEPGTFKDRVLMCDDPFAIVEAMTICGYATGSDHGFLYVRGEYPLAEERMAQAIVQARDADLLGDNVAGGGFRFDIEMRRGAGAYICGEETALFNSIEGRRGEPRSKPPFPAQSGLFGKPTVVNNVETLANVLDIMLEGGEAWARVGTKTSTGTRLFCLSGHVAQPGLYEVAFGTTLGELVHLAGGVAGGRELKGILLGGAAGVFVGPQSLDLKLTFEDVRAAGATLGSGVVMVFDDTTDFTDLLARIAEFFAHESCGQCVPCRVGTVRQREILDRLRHRQAPHKGVPYGASSSPNTDVRRAPLYGVPAVDDELALLTELGQAMRDASICGLGQTASSAIESAIANLRVFAEHGPRGTEKDVRRAPL
jgi:NADH-quinone oxidoreductase subunit F